MTEVRYTDPTTGGQKGTKAERFSLIPAPAMEEVARVYAMGAAKYEANNYLKGYPWSFSIDALERHIAKFKQCQDHDDESKLHHLAHAVFHCNALIMFGLYGLGTDDRWRPEGTAQAAPDEEPSIAARIQTALATNADPNKPRAAKVGDIVHGHAWCPRKVVKIDADGMVLQWPNDPADRPFTSYEYLKTEYPDDDGDDETSGQLRFASDGVLVDIEATRLAANAPKHTELSFEVPNVAYATVTG